MGTLAIKGHNTRGYEVIKILEILGGTNRKNSWGAFEHRLYFINTFGDIEDRSLRDIHHYCTYTLEEFLEKFPYKVGDRVRVAEYESEVRIDAMSWDGFAIQYQVFTDETEVYSAEELNKYNEIYKKETMEKEISDVILYRFICLEGYDFYDDKGNIIDTKEIIMKKKQPKYPKTFIECAKILDCSCSAYIDGYKCELIENLQELIICRDAYWKIAGDWKPNFKDIKTRKYTIGYVKNDISCLSALDFNRILSFPTKEMRDAFYENFKELIEECKELL